MPDVDIAIIGGGCAGLSLGHRLADRELSFRIVEPRPVYSNDRTWSFWRTQPHMFEDIIEGSWPAWSVSGPNRTVRRQSTAHPYQTLASNKFYDRVQERVTRSQNGHLSLGNAVSKVTTGARQTVLTCADGDFSARHVIDTRPPRHAASYTQFFLGYEIATERAAFDTGTVHLMHFRQGYSAGVDFLYVLPFARDRALVEVTCFSPQRPELDTLRQWLETEIAGLGIESYSLLRRETGALPMEVGFRTPAQPGTVHIGIAGGAARPSTGYAFQRIQHQSDQLARQLLRGDDPVIPSDGWVTQTMDAIFLRVLKTYPHRGPAFFESLFANVPPQRLVRFLSGSTRASDRLSIIKSLPPWPFLVAAASLR